MRIWTQARKSQAWALALVASKSLAEKAGVSWGTVQRMEASDGLPSASAKSLDAVQRALVAAGIEFTDDDAPGGRLRKRDLPVRNKPPT